MILSDRSLIEALDCGRIEVDPIGEGCLQPSSLDIRVDKYFRTYRHTPWSHPIIDPKQPQEPEMDYWELDDIPFRLEPQQFALASTVEHVRVADDLVGRVEGKSSIGRMGLLVHATAGFIDAGFSGFLTLELSNLTDRPWFVYPGMTIAQISFQALTTSAAHPYGSSETGSKYQEQRGPTPSLYHKNFP